MRYVIARYEQNQRELAYRIYLTDALKLAFRLDSRYYDIIFPQKVEQNEAEIKSRVERLKSKLRD